ncbi:Panacea domain-containing protein [Clostridium baratii]|uniref:Panacea domain-containing protein n=1 Tax=Clostridium baratii TaxID=1561 RepID=UPI0030CB5360
MKKEEISMYDAIDIAKYIINKCIDLDRPISNLQLQKILYYVQGAYMKETNGYLLFKNKISAWQYGPAVPDVYFEFNNYSSSEIDIKYPTIELPDEIKKVIDPVIKKKSLLTAWKLVEDTHNEMPWKESYSEGERCDIDYGIMTIFFCKNVRDI